jgi:hypothetical protein
VICLAKVKKKKRGKDCALMTSASFYRSKQNATSKFRMNFPGSIFIAPSTSAARILLQLIQIVLLAFC